MNPTTQLVEAIEETLRSYSIHTIYGRDGKGAEAAKWMDYVDAEHAILLAIADAVDTQIGEDVTQQERHWSDERADWCGKDETRVGRVCICDQLNAQKARMRTFTAALREAAK